MEESRVTTMSSKNRMVALLLAFLFGVFGGHRFYAGKTKTAIIQLLTLGGLGFWTLVDFVLILCGEFTDADGKRIGDWSPGRNGAFSKFLKESLGAFRA